MAASTVQYLVDTIYMLSGRRRLVCWFYGACPVRVRLEYTPFSFCYTPWFFAAALPVQLGTFGVHLVFLLQPWPRRLTYMTSNACRQKKSGSLCVNYLTFYFQNFTPYSCRDFELPEHLAGWVIPVIPVINNYTY